MIRRVGDPVVALGRRGDALAQDVRRRTTPSSARGAARRSRRAGCRVCARALPRASSCRCRPGPVIAMRIRAGTRRARRPPPIRRPRCARRRRRCRRRARRASSAGRSRRPATISISSPNAMRPWRARWSASGPAAEPVAGSSVMPRPSAEHARLPAQPVAGEAVDPDRAELGELLESRDGSAATSSSEPSATNTCGTPLSYSSTGSCDSTPSTASSSSAPSNGLDRRQRLRHPAEDDARALPLELDRNRAAGRLDLDLDELQRRREHERGPERRVAGERQLGRRREDPHAHVPVGLRRIDEGRLGEVRLLGQPLQLLLRDPAGVREDGELVALRAACS